MSRYHAGNDPELHHS